MDNDFRIVLSDNLLPVQAFFNAISESSFIQTLEAFSSGIGASFNDCHCEFPGDLDPDDDPIEGVQFALYDQEVVISKSEFLEYLEHVCKSFASERPDLEDKVFEKLDAVKNSMEWCNRDSVNSAALFRVASLGRVKKWTYLN